MTPKIITYKARAATNHHAELVKSLLLDDRRVANVKTKGCLLIFDCWQDFDTTFDILAFTIRDEAPEAHQLIATFAPKKNFTGEINMMNCLNFDILTGKIN